MLTAINPKLPMTNLATTKDFYINQLQFELVGEYDQYLMVSKDLVEIHFFAYKDLNVLENDGQVYIRTDDIEGLYQTFLKNQVSIHPNGALQIKPWGQKEFSILDPDHNLLTFGQRIA
ncbi:MAG: glyoxalase/bleomycin resistance/extradiol dioxygenase family protein [Flavobacterium sp. BFFFF2]|nr:MAG: glyoxalase/bleomycin resistance/extradiol dioxygenase family protein [Flavobacterium sp. BFFFF2]